ncbi:hypothetical protein AB8O38_09895 [Saccharomonospora xinjiangensis]|uniref:hypothetical protein n=1 Tax=Saccharomonospora xinjiangensis TaxID=75294 RepID=UPI0035103DDC
MPQHTPDHDHEHDSGGDDATVLPFRATRSATQDAWRVERIDTEPMTIQQYDLAVTTLATLISQWHNQENTKEGHEKAA